MYSVGGTVGLDFPLWAGLVRFFGGTGFLRFCLPPIFKLPSNDGALSIFIPLGVPVMAEITKLQTAELRDQAFSRLTARIMILWILIWSGMIVALFLFGGYLPGIFA